MGSFQILGIQEKSPGDQRDASGSEPWPDELRLCQLQLPRRKAEENFKFFISARRLVAPPLKTWGRAAKS